MNASSVLTKQQTEDGGWLNVVREQVTSLRYGIVQIVVHDSRVVQIERTEKVRLERATEKKEPKAE